MAAPRSLDSKTEQKIAAAYARGESTSTLAEEHNVHPSTIRNVVVRSGGALRARGGVAGVSRTSRR